VSLPFLIILSLGYDLSLQNKSFSNTLAVYIETVPRGAEIKTKNYTYKTPTELKIPQNQETSLLIKKDNFIDESLVFSPVQKENTTVKLSNFWMLPAKPSNNFRLEDSQGLTILSKDYILTKNQDNYFVQDYGFGGLQSKPMIIQNSSNSQIKSGSWRILLENFFWKEDQNILLYQNSNKIWEFLDLKKFGIEFVSVAKISNFQLILLDNQKILWSLNLNTNILSFLDKGYEGLSFTDSPDIIWLLSQNKILALRRNFINLESFSVQKETYATSNLFNIKSKNSQVLSFNNFIPKSVFLGTAFKIQDSIFYINDSNKSNIQVIAKNVAFVGTQNSTIFWLDKDKNFFSYSFLLKQKQHFGQINVSLDDIKISYFSHWKRFFIYSPEKVISFWYDTDATNKSVLDYSINTWINNDCFPEILDNYQFCIAPQEMIVYKNNSIAW
jgi:hypothetical protein